MTLTDAEIDGLIAAHRPGWSLAQPFYNSPQVFERDLERIIFKQWLFIDHASRIPRPGDYFLFEIAGESLIISRGREGEVHALFNVCRHRGSRVCLEPAGSAKAFVCPYHAWSYGLDGRLLGAPAMADDFNRSEFGLRRAHVRLVEDLIFICLADSPPDMEKGFRSWQRFMAPHGLKEAKIAHRLAWRLKANWKLVIENFRECYHCGPAHPEYTAVMAHALPDSTGSAAQAKEFNVMRETWVAQAKAMGSLVDRSPEDGKDPGTTWKPEDPHAAYSCGRLPIRPGFLSQSRDGRLVAPCMGEFKESDGGLTAGRLDPVNFFMASCDHAVVPRFTPIGAELTDVEIIWFIRADAVEGADYQIDDLAWLWKVPTEQDNKIVEDNQAGVNSRAYRPGPYSRVEDGCRRFTLEYLREIS